ncbi:unnamed protein product [Ilex paraguariensis]|uniref:Uncharacterized protein n=1 Tax=Ilex paraguariensis TaxID=185542 RepID=A0ABC8SZU8_9AQUA
MMGGCDALFCINVVMGWLSSLPNGAARPLTRKTNGQLVSCVVHDVSCCGSAHRIEDNRSFCWIDDLSSSFFTLQKFEDALLPFPEGTELDGKIVHVTSATRQCITKLHNFFETCMSDDLHTPTTVDAAVTKALRLMNHLLNLLKSLTELEKEVREVLNVLGLLSSSTYSEVLWQLIDKALKRAKLTEDDVSHLIEERAGK